MSKSGWGPPVSKKCWGVGWFRFRIQAKRGGVMVKGNGEDLSAKEFLKDCFVHFFLVFSL